MGTATTGDPNAPDGDRGLGKALLVGAGAAVAGMAAYAAYSKTWKKKKKVKTKHGKTREVDCDVMVDESGREIPGQEFDETGRCINADQILPKPEPYGANAPPAQQPGGAGAAPPQPANPAAAAPAAAPSGGAPGYLGGVGNNSANPAQPSGAGVTPSGEANYPGAQYGAIPK